MCAKKTKKSDHKISDMEIKKKGNNYVTMNSADDTIKNKTGDNNSIMVTDSPDDANL